MDASLQHRVGGVRTQTCTSVSFVSMWYGSSQHAAAEKGLFFILPIPPKSSSISAVVLLLTKLLASPAE